MMEHEREGSRVIVPVSTLDRGGDRERIIHPQPRMTANMTGAPIWNLSAHRQEAIDRERVDTQQEKQYVFAMDSYRGINTTLA